MRHFHDSQHAGLVEVNIDVGEFVFLEVLAVQDNGGHGSGLLLVHHGEGGLVDAGRNVGDRIGISGHVRLGKVHPSAGFGGFLGILSGGKGFVNSLLHFCVGLLSIRYLQGAGKSESEK